MTGELPPSPPSADRPLVLAITVSVVLLVIAILGGSTVARLGRAAPAPATTSVPPPAVPSGVSESTAAFVFAQPLSAGCAAGDAVYVVSDGGGIGRFAVDQWQLIDPVARSLVAAACRGDVLTAVGGGGRVVTINDREQTVRSDTVLIEDFLGVTSLGDGVLVVGRSGTVQRQSAGGWGPYAAGIDEDLFAVAAFGASSAWAVGAGGVTYRLEPAGWRPVHTDVTATLRAISATSVDDAVAVGDDGAILVWGGRWTQLADVPRVGYRAVLRAGPATYAAGDAGTLIRFTGTGAVRSGSSAVERIDLGTSCTLRALFSRADEIWIIGSDGGRAGVWRLRAGTTFHYGQCP